jgi:cell wall-associated NlpC family hydrolase
MRAPLIMLLAVLTGGCAATGAVPRPFPTPSPPPAPAGPLPEGLEPRPPVESTALSLRGAPYRDGGDDPSGFDCSGFVSYVFGQQGLFVPRTVTEQFAAGQQVEPPAIAPGDLVFFSTIAPGASHVGIAISADEFVHAPSSVGVVRVEGLRAPYWASRFVGARRLW